MTRYSVRVMWSDEDKSFVAVCPELNGVSALGSTLEEAITELNVAMELALDAYKEEGWPLPEPDLIQPFSGQFRLRVPKSLHRWLSEQAEIEHVSLNSFVMGVLSRTRGGVEGEAVAAEEVRQTIGEMRSSLASLVRSAMFDAAENTERFIEGTVSADAVYRFGTRIGGAGIVEVVHPRRQEEAWQSSSGR